MLAYECIQRVAGLCKSLHCAGSRLCSEDVEILRRRKVVCVASGVCVACGMRHVAWMACGVWHYGVWHRGRGLRCTVNCQRSAVCRLWRTAYKLLPHGQSKLRLRETPPSIAEGQPPAALRKRSHLKAAQFGRQWTAYAAHIEALHVACITSRHRYHSCKSAYCSPVSPLAAFSYVSCRISFNFTYNFTHNWRRLPWQDLVWQKSR